jgi:hypothetical protein
LIPKSEVAARRDRRHTKPIGKRAPSPVPEDLLRRPIGELSNPDLRRLLRVCVARFGADSGRADDIRAEITRRINAAQQSRRAAGVAGAAGAAGTASGGFVADGLMARPRPVKGGRHIVTDAEREAIRQGQLRRRERERLAKEKELADLRDDDRDRNAPRQASQAKPARGLGITIKSRVPARAEASDVTATPAVPCVCDATASHPYVTRRRFEGAPEVMPVNPMRLSASDGPPPEEFDPFNPPPGSTLPQSAYTKSALAQRGIYLGDEE